MVNVNALTQFYRCTQNAPLGCQKAQHTIDTISRAKFCLDCGFPTPLPSQAELRGRLGTYQITESLPARGMGRLYRAVQIGNGQPVVVKEYLLLDRCFNPTEVQQRKAALLQTSQSGFEDQKGMDFRVISPVESFADATSDRIYMIFPGHLAASPTLRAVLQDQGAFSADRVRQVLHQVLQTLHFLHRQPLGSASSGQRTGAAHGNIRLDSLLLNENFYVYTCDPNQWEQLVHPSPPQPLSPAIDLQDLGLVGFSLWTGLVAESQAELKTREDTVWPSDDPDLKQFLCRLLGFEQPFESAEAARLFLLRLPPASTQISGVPAQRPVAGKVKPKFRLYWLLSLLTLPILGGLLWLFLPRSMSDSYAEVRQFKHLLPSFEDVNGIEPGQYPYTGERFGTWTTVLDKKPVSDRKIRELLTQPKPEVAAMFEYRGYHPTRSPLEEVLQANEKAHFAIAAETTPLPNGLVQEAIAYDGLLIYVPAYKSQNLPRALKGRISLAQLKKIFTGEVTHWRELGESFPDLPIKPYRPSEPEALRFFQQKVIGNDPQLIAKFNQIEKRPTFSTLRAIASAEKLSQTTEAGTISFGFLTQTWDQCKVYPLAVSATDAAPTQPLLRETTQGTLNPISFTDNLCREKKPLPNLPAFQQKTYPLSLPLVIAYPRDNNLPGHQSGPLFAKFLKTQDGQYLLQQTGLVPLQPTPKSHRLSSNLLNR